MNPISIKRLSNIPLRVISCDPGGGKAGYAVLDYCPKKKRFLIVHMETMKGDTLVKKYFDKEFVKQNDARLVRNMAHGKHMGELLTKYKPNFVAIEGAYSRRPQAFRSLVEHATIHRVAVYNYNPLMVFETISASEVKACVGVKGNSGDKDLITKALELRSKKDLRANGNVFAEHEEHANDAVAIGLCAITNIINPKPVKVKTKSKNRGKGKRKKG